MAQDNLISASLSQADLNDILAALNVVKTKLPFLVNLSKEDRVGLAKMGDKSVAFNDKALEYAQKNPILVPAFLDMAEYKKDADLTSALNTISREIEPLAQAIEDTLMLVGSESLAASRTFYKSAQQGAKNNVPGARAIVDDLSARFPGGSRSGSKGSGN